MIIEQQVKKDNKLIAEFMGYTVYEKRYPRNHGIGAYGHSNAIIPKDCILEKLKYNISWDALMPVVEHIESMNVNVKIEDTSCTIETNDGTWSESSSCMAGCSYENEIDCDTKLEAAYLSVIEFIKWYNSKKPAK